MIFDDKSFDIKNVSYVTGLWGWLYAKVETNITSPWSEANTRGDHVVFDPRACRLAWQSGSAKPDSLRSELSFTSSVLRLIPT